MRIIFVGMNNKPGTAPLDSSTKSGKLIDRVIECLPGFECVKSNLWDLDHFPKSDSFNYEWVERVGYISDDIIIALGACVQDAFKRSPFPFVAVGHPSAVWSNEKKREYVKRCLERLVFSTNIVIEGFENVLE